MTHKDGHSFAADIEAVAGDEPIEAVVVGSIEDGFSSYYFPKGKPPVGILTWEMARPFLDYSYSPGYGGAECAPVWVWTPTRVLFVGTYDGATWVDAVPRNPTEGDPNHVGGG